MISQKHAAILPSLEPVVFSLTMTDPTTHEESSTVFAALDNDRVADKARMIASLHGLSAVSWKPASTLH